MPHEVTANHRSRSAHPRKAMDEDGLSICHRAIHHVENGSQRFSRRDTAIGDGYPKNLYGESPILCQRLQLMRIALHPLPLFRQVHKRPHPDIQEGVESRASVFLIEFNRMFSRQQLARHHPIRTGERNAWHRFRHKGSLPNQLRFGSKQNDAVELTNLERELTCAIPAPRLSHWLA